jgi:hypothetical protein
MAGVSRFLWKISDRTLVSNIVSKIENTYCETINLIFLIKKEK